MAYVTAEARQQLLDDLAAAIDSINLALATLGAAYELLDNDTADRLEAQLFRPVQAAYGRARRTYSEFAARYGLASRAFTPVAPGPPSLGVRGFLDRAADAVDDADDALIEIQDSMMPVEVGDPQLRAGLAEVRELVGTLRASGRELVRTLGR
jgi:hypothetical protein